MKTNRLMLAGLAALGMGAAWALADDPPATPPKAATEAPSPAAAETRDAGAHRPTARPLGGRGDLGDRVLEQIQQRNPEEYKKLMDLREKDADAFRAKLRELMQKGMTSGRGGVPAEEEKANEAAKRYLAATTPEEKEQLKADLRKAVEAAFDKRQEQQKRRLADLEAGVKKAKDEFESRQKNRASIIQKRIEELTTDPKLRWGTPGGVPAATAPAASPATPPATPAPSTPSTLSTTSTIAAPK